ncbi:WXG100 family type VII secretion target [Tenggerimyces flavus]|uniref:ESAT-6-like protein n=1 Tax=Tenggerimyces flavus TaxID=1708749 RepID=A0ABV7YSI4_9ACTN|nr:WXG100 family type VII secretion target [Tenggerimyces flavus]MBM7784502.1 WXG100 family type VII secretion target [Tenggerimyces flavus]
MSDGSFTQWNAGAMTQAVADLRSAYRMTKDELDDLETVVESRLAEWTGDARGAYTTAKKQWDKDANELNDVLERLGAGVEDVHGNYNQAERDGVGIFEG